jgi:hypothetical protein
MFFKDRIENALSYCDALEANIGRQDSVRCRRSIGNWCGISDYRRPKDSWPADHLCSLETTAYADQFFERPAKVGAQNLDKDLGTRVHAAFGTAPPAAPDGTLLLMGRLTWVRNKYWNHRDSGRDL